MGSVIVGALLWLLVWWLARAGARAGARTSTRATRTTRVTRTNSAKWEQDAPYPECFDDHDLYDDLEDDL